MAIKKVQLGKAAGLATAIAMLSAPSYALVTDYFQDFEALATAGSGSETGTELGDDGWLIFAAVTDGAGTYPGAFKFQYGTFAAPNGGPGFSGVATGDNTDTSGNPIVPIIGLNYMNVYSDYNCCGLNDPTPQGHGDQSAPYDVVQALVLREYPIATADIGKTVTFSFDAKRPNFEDDGFGGDSSAAVGNNCVDASGNPLPCTATAFVKTIDPGAGFATTNLLVEDMTSISQGTWTTYSITINLTDPALEGQLLQVGFENFSSQFNNTGVYYDNIAVTTIGGDLNVPFPGFALAGIGALLAYVGARGVRSRVSGK